MKSVFQDFSVQRAYEEYGFVILPFFSNEGLDRLAQFFREETIQEARAFYTSTDLNEPSFRLSGDQRIRNEVRRAGIEFIVDGYSELFGSFIVKQPAEMGDSTVDLHSDWSIQDETRHYALTLWFPLQDVDVQNGCMHVVPGSHRKIQRIRGVGIPEPYRKYRSLFQFKDLVALPMKKGQVLCYHNALLHASPPNSSSEQRLACLVACHPKSVQPVLYYQRYWRLRTPVQQYAVNRNFFAAYDKRSRPAALTLAGSQTYVVPRLSRFDFLNFRNPLLSDRNACYFT